MTQQETGKSAQYLTMIAALSISMGTLSMSSYVPSMTAISAGLNADLDAVRLALSIFLIGQAVGQLVFGPISDRFGRRPVLMVGIILYVLSCLGCALASSIDQFMVLRFSQALGAAAGGVISRAIIRDSFDTKTALKAMGTVGTFLAIAPAVGVVMGGLIQANFAWQILFFVLAVFGGFMLLMIAITLPETLNKAARAPLTPKALIQTYWMILTSRVFLGYAIPGGIFLGGLFSFQAIAPSLLMDQAGLKPDIFGYVMMVTVFGFFLGSTIAKKYAQQIGPQKMLLAALPIGFIAAGIMAVLGSLYEPTPISVMPPMVIWTVGLGMALPSSMAGGMKPFGKNAGSASALLGSSQFAIAGISSAIIAYTSASTELAMALLLLGLATVGLIFYLIIPKQK